MKKDWSEIERYRVTKGEYGTQAGNSFGLFVIPDGKRQIRAIAADGELTGWEHVSVSILYRNGDKKTVSVMPTWDDMCRIKDLFWDRSECVVQFHPPESEYVNTHAKCLHLWKCLESTFPMPPKVCV